MVQTYATTRRPYMADQGARIRRRADYLPILYAERAEREFEKEKFETEKEQFEREFQLGEEQFNRQFEREQAEFAETTRLARQGQKLQKRSAKESEATAKATLGITGGMTGLKAMDMFKGSEAYNKDWYSGEWGSVGPSDLLAGASGGAMAAGLAKGLGGRKSKKWQTTTAGVVGGTALTYLSGGDDPLSMVIGGLIGGGLGALF